MLKKTILLLLIFGFSTYLFAATKDIDQRRIYMLEYALAPKNPQTIAQLWAQAAKNRNGAVQYMLLCPALQQANLANLQQLNWVTGVSSPQIKSFQIINKGKQDTHWQYNIQYQIALNNKVIGKVTDNLQIIKVDPKSNSSQQWCISQFNLLSPSTTKPS